MATRSRTGRHAAPKKNLMDRVRASRYRALRRAAATKIQQNKWALTPMSKELAS